MTRRPRDYRARGAAYDALMVGISAHYLALLETSTLMEGEEIEAELATIEAILADRKAGLHRPVTWRSIDREVCTCSLLLPRDQSLAEATGHVDPVTHRLVGTILVEDGPLRLGVCQHCAATYRDDSFERLRRWQRVHQCPPDGPWPEMEPEPRVGPVDVARHRSQEAYFRAITDGLRHLHPRSDGPQESDTE